MTSTEIIQNKAKESLFRRMKHLNKEGTFYKINKFQQIDVITDYKSLKKINKVFTKHSKDWEYWFWNLFVLEKIPGLKHEFLKKNCEIYKTSYFANCFITKYKIIILIDDGIPSKKKARKDRYLTNRKYKVFRITKFNMKIYKEVVEEIKQLILKHPMVTATSSVDFKGATKVIGNSSH